MLSQPRVKRRSCEPGELRQSKAGELRRCDAVIKKWINNVIFAI